MYLHSVPSKPKVCNCAVPPDNLRMLSHTRALPTFWISYGICIYIYIYIYTVYRIALCKAANASLFAYLHGWAVACASCATKQIHPTREKRVNANVSLAYTTIFRLQGIALYVFSWINLIKPQIGGHSPVGHQNSWGWDRPSGVDSDKFLVCTRKEDACFVSGHSTGW